jgi:hypothetical protein
VKFEIEIYFTLSCQAVASASFTMMPPQAMRNEDDGSRAGTLILDQLLVSLFNNVVFRTWLPLVPYRCNGASFSLAL